MGRRPVFAVFEWVGGGANSALLDKAGQQLKYLLKKRPYMVGNAIVYKDIRPELQVILANLMSSVPEHLVKVVAFKNYIWFESD
jgi:hypothetical protein